jgi:coenzyme F420 hydrogenase subunit beta
MNQENQKASSHSVPRIERHYQNMSVRHIGFEVGTHIGFVVEHSLCTGCATCEAICPEDAISMQYNACKGIYEAIVNETLCTHCELCVMACPGFELDMYDRHESQRELPYHPLVGPYRELWRAWTNNEQRRLKGASGGMITEVLDYMFKQGEIDGAIVSRMNPDAPLEVMGYIATTPEELQPSQKSHYTPNPLNAILKPIIRGEMPNRRLAFVGLPSHVHGLRLVQKLYPHTAEQIPYVLSMFTSHVPSRRATEFLLYKKKLHPKDVALLEYRGGGVPGRIRVVLKDDSEHVVPHLHWTYWGHSFPYFFYPVREWLYFDKLSEWADFSMGDNWQKGLREQGGASTIVTRSDKAAAIIRQMIAEEIISTTPMSAEDLVHDQRLHTKLNIGIRLKVWQLLGREIPIYTHHLPVRWKDFLRTFRFSLHVLLSEHAIPFPIMEKIILTDYILRKKLPEKIKTLKRFVNVLLPERKFASKPSAKYKIVMIGGFGGHDIGDEAMPHADRINLKKLLKNDVDIVMVSHDPEYTSVYHGERAIYDIRILGFHPKAPLPQKIRSLGAIIVFLSGAVAQKYGIRLRLWHSARNLLDELSNADILFNVGGGNLNSIIAPELYKKCTTYLVARILNKPVLISGQTIGPFSRLIDMLYARVCMDKVHMITFRDRHTSQERLRKIGVSAPQMMDTADDAMTIPVISRQEALEILNRETKQDWNNRTSLLVFMNMKGSLKLFKGSDRQQGLTREIVLMAEIADHIIEDFQASIVFLPTDYNPAVDDRPIHREVVSHMKQGNRAFCVEEELPDSALKGLIGLADAVIGARYHFCVFAASLSIPFLGIASGQYQQTKLQGLANLCNLPDSFVHHDMEFATFEEVYPQVVAFLNNREDIQSTLHQVAPLLEERSLTVVKEAVNLLQQR